MERGRIVFVSAAALTVAVLVGAVMWLAQPDDGGAIDVGTAGGEAGTEAEVGSTSPPPSTHPPLATTVPDPPWSLSSPTAPGPGQLADTEAGGTTTTEGATVPATSGTLAPGETLPPEPPDPSNDPTGSTFNTTVPPTTTEPPPPEAERPAGPWVEDRVVVVAEGTVDGRSYSVGTYWTPWLGLCIGTNFEASALEGGFPSACRPEPGIGGGSLSVEGGNRTPGVGGVAAVFTPAEIDRATFVVDGVEHEATLHRVDDFPEFTYAVFVLPGLDAEGTLAHDLPGEVALWLDGQPVGWG